MKKTGGVIIESCAPNPGYSHRCLRLALLCLVLHVLAGCHKDENPLSHEEIIQADLQEILELQGYSCDEVVKFEVGGRLDYHVECQSGERYRIQVSSEGHVQAEQQREK